MLQEIPSLKTFSIVHYRDDELDTLNDLWLNILIKDSSTDVLLPNLTSLIYNPIFELEEDMCEEFALLAGAVSSRRRYSKDFRFYVPKPRFSEGFLKNLKIPLPMIDTHAIPNDPYHLDILFHHEY